MRSRLLAAVTLLLVVAVVAVVVWRAAGDEPGRTPAAAGPASLDELAAADPVVARTAFCDDVPAARVAAALGRAAGSSEAQSSEAQSYGNGDPVTLGSSAGAGVTDVAHEYGCSWTADDGAAVRAWVFAPPVTAVRGKRLARLAGSGAGCTPYDAGAGAGFGEPSAAYACTGTDETTAGRAGLFGDAWLACTVAAPAGSATDPADLRERADRWCVDVALAAE